MELYVLADGLQCMRYAEIRGIKPYAVFWRNRYLRDRVPFISKDSALLVIVHGCTTMKDTDVTVLVNSVVADNVFDEVCVYSNVELPKLEIPYYLYSGDLFDSAVKLVQPGGRVVKQVGASYIYKFTKEPYISEKTDVVGTPYNAAKEKFVREDITDVIAIDVFAYGHN